MKNLAKAARDNTGITRAQSFRHEYEAPSIRQTFKYEDRRISFLQGANHGIRIDARGG